ncbi:MAG: DUF2268 domain-containing putative Zn-dependent protease [Parvularculaceae bacterium]
MTLLLSKRAIAATAALCAQATLAAEPADDFTPVIETSDVDLFYRLYEAADGAPSAETLQTDYIDAGSEGLKALARRRRVDGARIAEAVEKRPRLYEKARDCANVLPAAKARLEDALRQLRTIYPEARFPAVTIAVGRGKPVGIGYPDTGVQIGLEAMCAAAFLNPDIEDRFVHVIAHEFVHVQQSPALGAKIEDGEPTVLDVSLQEGVAEFVGELISGDIAYGSLRGDVAGREAEIERAFLADKDKTDLSVWVYNSTPDAPGDLGYWVGYRIARAYHRNAEDKRQAIRELLETDDPDAILEASGWRPGVILD